MTSVRRTRRDDLETAADDELEGLRGTGDGEYDDDEGEIGVSRTHQRRAESTGMTLHEFVKLSITGIVVGLVFVLFLDTFAPWQQPSSAGPLSTVAGQDTRGAGSSGEIFGKVGSTSAWANDEENGVPARSPTLLPPTPPPHPLCLHSREYGLPLWMRMSDVARKSAKTVADVPDDATFYILEDDKALSTDVVTKCLLNALDVPLAKDGDAGLEVSKVLKDANARNLANLQYALTDLALLEGFRRHPNRVYKKEDAKFVLLGYLPYLSYELPDADILLEFCPWLEDGLVSHTDRMQAAMDALDGSIWANETERSRFMMIHARPLGDAGMKHAISPELAERLANGKVRLLTSSSTLLEKTLKKALKRKVWKKTSGAQDFMENIIRVPLVGNPYLTARAYEETDREVQFLFDEEVGTSSVAKGLRNLQHQMVISRARIAGRLHPLGLMDPRKQSALLMQRSEHCFVLDRDSKDTLMNGVASLYDALRAGCIPILLFDTIPLPFASLIDWEKIVYITAGLTCLGDSMLEIPMLERMVQDPEAKTRHRTALREALPFLEFSPTIADPRRADASSSSAAQEGGISDGSTSEVLREELSKPKSRAFGVINAILIEASSAK